MKNKGPNGCSGYMSGMKSNPVLFGYYFKNHRKNLEQKRAMEVPLVLQIAKGQISRWWQLKHFVNFQPNPFGNDQI